MVKIAVKERPILFNGEMVRAILEGRKTQTRRVIKGMPDIENLQHLVNWERVSCPYGQVGNGLWVREKWRIDAWDGEEGFMVEYMSDGKVSKEWLNVDDEDRYEKLWVQSTDDALSKLGQKEEFNWDSGESPCRIRPSIFMPRWASRINLEITGIRVERVQDISEEDAKAEGIKQISSLGPMRAFGWKDYQGGIGFFDPRESFKSLWNLINFKRGFGWSKNPFCWALTFKIV